MSTTKVFRYKIDVRNGEEDLPLPKHAHPLSVGLDPSGDLCLWALVDPAESIFETLAVYVVGTGHEVDLTNASGNKFLGTVLDGDLVWHVFGMNVYEIPGCEL
jgi:hypothetical protein